MVGLGPEFSRKIIILSRQRNNAVSVGRYVFLFPSCLGHQQDTRQRVGTVTYGALKLLKITMIGALRTRIQ